jgi:hypothetical protein
MVNFFEVQNIHPMNKKNFHVKFFVKIIVNFLVLSNSAFVYGGSILTLWPWNRTVK